MRHSNPLIRFGKLVALGAVVAGVSASAAMAIPVFEPQNTGPATAAVPVSRPPDVQDTATALYAPTTAGLKADGMRLQGIAQAYLVPSTSASPTRPPDVADTALAVRYAPTASVEPNGFDWTDWAIGIGSGLGLALVLGAGVLMARQLRHPVPTA
jgi:hypothetical protein